MKRLFVAMLFCTCTLIFSAQTFAQTAEDAGLSSEINSEEASSEGSVQAMESSMDVGSPDMGS